MNVHEKLDSVINRIDILERFLKENVHGANESIPSTDWTDSQDELQLGGFLIHANYSNWKMVKEYLSEQKFSEEGQFYLEIEDVCGGELTYGNNITLSEAKQLRDYLSEKIEYLEGK